MRIDTSKTYETHRPRELVGNLEAVKRLLTPEQFKKFEESRDKAKTSGPLMVGGQPATMQGADVLRIYDKALLEGANPCYVDEESGQVFLGEFVFVPREET